MRTATAEGKTQAEALTELVVAMDADGINGQPPPPLARSLASADRVAQLLTLNVSCGSQGTRWTA